MALGSGYQRSMILLCSVRLGIFRGLADSPLCVSELARKISADVSRLEILLNALVSLGLLSRAGNRYRLSRVAREFLLPGKHSQESILLHLMNCWEAWGNLTGKILKGRKKRDGEDKY